VLKGIGTGVFLWGATSKRDSMWHSPVFTCIRANRIPVEIYNKPSMNYAVMWMQILCLVSLLLAIQTLLMNKVCHKFKRKSSAQILFPRAIVFVRDKYGQLVKCWEFLDSTSEDRIIRESLVHLLPPGRFKSHVPIEGIFEVKRTIHYEASLEVI
jgi:hypothetical protein